MPNRIKDQHLSFIEPDNESDDIYSSDVEEYARDINPMLEEAGLRGICTHDVHKRYGYARQGLTVAAIKYCGVEESSTILPTRYFKSDREQIQSQFNNRDVYRKYPQTV